MRARFRAALAGGLLAPLGMAVVAVLAGEAAGWRFLRPALERELSVAIGVPVAIGEPFRLRLLGAPQATAQRLTVGVARGLPAPHLLDADGLRLSWRWHDVWAATQGRTLRVRELEMARLDLHLVRDAQGRANWQLGAATAPGSAWSPPLIERVAVHSGSVRVDDRPQALRISAPIEGATPRDEVPAGWPRLLLAGRARP